MNIEHISVERRRRSWRKAATSSPWALVTAGLVVMTVILFLLAGKL